MSDKEAAKVNMKINQFLKEEKKRLDSEITLLLLGTGESGKSTFAKQMKLLYMNGFNDEERKEYREVIFGNVSTAMKNLINAAHKFGLEIVNKEAEKIVMNIDRPRILTDKEIDAVKTLWKESAIQAAYQRRNEFQLHDGAQHYFDSLDRLGSPNYIPSVDDLLRSRTKTTGIIETEFMIEKSRFKLLDVGGQRSERKKWIHCFDGVTAILYCVALSEYDQLLYEDGKTNRMHEALRVFKDICTNEFLLDIPMIIFFNKKDLFEEKIKKSDLTCCWPEYNGGKNFENALDFIENKFLTQNTNTKKPIYTHTTVATDTKNVKVVFETCKDIILHKVLEESGLTM